MTAYALVSVEITDPDGFADYRKQVPATIAAFGGRFLARGGAMEVLEGTWIPKRVVIVEFPDFATATAWYHSAEYQQLVELRKRTAISDFVIVDGVQARSSTLTAWASETTGTETFGTFRLFASHTF